MLNATQLLDEAKSSSGLSDYGPTGFLEGFQVLITSINEEAGLTSEHEAPLREEILRVLINRLRMQSDLNRYPEILEEQLLPPVFITSMPRTGSTKLHRMLAACGDFNALPFWMSHNFAPFPGKHPSRPDPRIADAEAYLQWMYNAAPAYQRAHPQYVEETEEELALLDAGFNSLYRWVAYLHVPTYSDWVLANAGTDSLMDLRRMLQYIQWQHYRGRQRRWILKTPSLFGFEAEYSQVFPGTDFLVTHRDPIDTWPSVAALFCGVRSLFSDADFSDIAGPAMLAAFGQALPRHLAWREQYPPEKVLDIRFDNVVHHEHAVVQEVYQWLGMAFTSNTVEALDRWLALDRQRGHRRNTTTLRDYRLSPDQIHEMLDGYYRRYGQFLSVPETSKET